MSGGSRTPTTAGRPVSPPHRRSGASGNRTARPDIRIEVGTPEVRALIRKEFDLFLELIGGNLRSWFDAVVVPKDFDAEVIRWSEDEGYRSKRGKRSVIAKTVTAGGKVILVIHPDVYRDPYDTHVRTHFLFHETFHFIRSQRNPVPVALSALDRLYMDEASAFYEEYCAERFSLILCNELLIQKSDGYLEHQNIIYSGHHDNVSGIEQSLARIRRHVEELMIHGRGDRFLEDVKPITESLLLSYFYLLAFHQATLSSENREKYRLPGFFRQAGFLEIAALFNDGYPNPPPAGETVGAIKKVYGHFGFALEATDSGELTISVSLPRSRAFVPGPKN